MIKKISAVFLAFVLVVTMMTTSAFAWTGDGTQQAKFTLVADKQYVEPGETVTFSAYLELSEDATWESFGNFLFSFLYNSSVLTPGTVTWGPTVANFTLPKDAASSFNLTQVKSKSTADEQARMENAGLDTMARIQCTKSNDTELGLQGYWEMSGSKELLFTIECTVSADVEKGTPVAFEYVSGLSGTNSFYIQTIAPSKANQVKANLYDTTEARATDIVVGTEPCAEHTWDEGVVTTEPTCGEAGVRTLTCTVCSSTSEVEEPATGNHTASEKVAIENEVPASCKDNGSHDEVVYCSECGFEMSRENKVDLATGEHVYAEVVDSKEATCKEDGYEVKKCACGETQTTTFSKDEVAHTGGTATCMAAAVCDVCGNAYGDKDAANHTGNNTVVGKVEATCGADGYTGDTVCECGETVEKGEVDPATGAHIYEEVVDSKEATCKEDGYETKKCACGETYTTTFSKDEVAHTGGTATCMAAAVCDVCGNAYGDKDVANHTGNNTVVGKKEATCGADGYTGDTVCECGETVEKGEVDPATGKHTYESSVTKNPTCSRKGTMKYTCSECGHSYTEDIPALNHVRDGVSGLKEIPAVEATCKEPGKTAGEVCEYCNTQTIVPQTVPTKEHSWDNGVVTEPTYTSEGYTTFTCTACGETKVDNYVPKLEMNVSVAIRQPSITKIRCKDTIVLHTVVEGVEDYTVVWTADNENFVMTDLEDGKLEITSAEDGFTVFTATVYDAEGNAVGSDTVEMQSKADIWGKIGGFFRALFGSTLYYNY